MVSHAHWKSHYTCKTQAGVDSSHRAIDWHTMVQAMVSFPVGGPAKFKMFTRILFWASRTCNSPAKNSYAYPPRTRNLRISAISCGFRTGTFNVQLSCPKTCTNRVVILQCGVHIFTSSPPRGSSINTESFYK